MIDEIRVKFILPKYNKYCLRWLDKLDDIELVVIILWYECYQHVRKHLSSNHWKSSTSLRIYCENHRGRSFHVMTTLNCWPLYTVAVHQGGVNNAVMQVSRSAPRSIALNDRLNMVRSQHKCLRGPLCWYLPFLFIDFTLNVIRMLSRVDLEDPISWNITFITVTRLENLPVLDTPTQYNRFESATFRIRYIRRTVPFSPYVRSGIKNLFSCVMRNPINDGRSITISMDDYSLFVRRRVKEKKRKLCGTFMKMLCRKHTQSWLHWSCNTLSI